MILFAVETLCISILAMILSMLIIDERKNRQREMHLVKLKGYWDGSERRSTDRLNISLAVKYLVNGKSGNVRGIDISTKGIRILLDERIEKGTLLRLEIKLPGQDRIIKANGSVVWTKESIEDEKFSAKRLFNTGIRLIRFRDSDEKRLFDFIYNREAANA